VTRPARRIVVVTSRFPFGSQEAYLSAELEELTHYFEEVVVAPVRPPASPRKHIVPGGVEVLAWPLIDLNLLTRVFRLLATRPKAVAGAVAQVLGSRDPGRTKNLAVILKALALADWAIEHRVDHIHAYWTSTPATVAMVAALVSGVPWSATAHRWDIYERNAFDVKERSVSFVRTISSRGAHDLRERMPTLNGRVVEIGLGTRVDPPADPRNLRTRLSSEFNLVCPAALVPVKGHTTLLHAVARLQAMGVPVHCTLYGNGPLQNQLIAEAAELGLNEAVKFAGFVPHDYLRTAYRSGTFAALVMASRNAGEKMMEGLPAALIEAMAFGVPVVVTDSGSIGELVDDRCGLVVPPDDPERLAQALLDVYLDADAAEVRAQRAYAKVRERHDVRTQMRVLAAALQQRSSN
jgi:colanic acid/amylovoran biosynthesis glycosyltransferase